MTNTMSCGCKIISDNLGAYKIEYCPKHGAADDMLEILKTIIDKWHEDCVRLSEISTAGKVITKADGGN